VNPYGAEIVLRPRTVGEVADLGVLLLHRYVAAVWPLVALAWVGGALVVLAVARSGVFMGGVLSVVAALVTAPVLQAPLTLALGAAVFGSRMGAWDAVRGVGGLNALRLLLARATLMLLVACSLGLLALPLAGPSLYWTETIVLERCNLTQAVGRSRSLAAHHPGRTLGVLVTLAGTALLGGLWARQGGALVAEWLLAMPDPFEGTGWALGAALGLVVVHPAVAALRLAAYLDVRTTVEAWDLEVALRARALEGA
jgi:hypothetical protein